MSSSSSDSEEKAVEERRRRLALARARVQEQSESEESSSSSDAEPVRLKPVFIPKSKRPALEDQQQEGTDSDDEGFAQRQREKVLQEALLDQEPQVSETWSDLQPKAPPIGDEDTDENYQQWKLRELKRILRFRAHVDPDEDEMSVEQATKQSGVFFR